MQNTPMTLRCLTGWRAERPDRLAYRDIAGREGRSGAGALHQDAGTDDDDQGDDEQTPTSAGGPAGGSIA